MHLDTLLTVQESPLARLRGQSQHFTTTDVGTRGTKRSSTLEAALLVLLLILLAGCKSPEPSLTFTQVPVAAAGGPDNVATIEGDVHHARAGQRLLLYSKADAWFLQPEPERHIIQLDPRGHWKTEVHLGSDYAAVLVNPGFTPAANLATLPAVGDGVAAVLTATGVPEGPFHSTLPTHNFRFSGYDWLVRIQPNVRLGPHAYSDRNVSLDEQGFLHLKVTQSNAGWVCSEIKLGRSLGYGTYSFTVEDSTHLDPAVVLQMYTWSDAGLAYNHREMNINLSRWGHPEGNNAEFIVQPFFIKTNSYRFSAPAGLHTYSFRWAPGNVLFRSVNGGTDSEGQKPIATHTFVANIPPPGDEATTMTFCELGMSETPLKREAGIVVERFKYLP